MPVIPAAALGAIEYGTDPPAVAAKLSYDIPLPSSQSGRRLVTLKIGIAAGDWLPTAAN